MSNDWTNKLRDHLADYQEPVKDDLWAAIEQSLAQKPTKPARFVQLRRFSMAAAIAALAVGGTYVYLHPWNEVKDAQVASVMKQASQSQEKMDEARNAQNGEGNESSQMAEKPSGVRAEASSSSSHSKAAEIIKCLCPSVIMKVVSDEEKELVALAQTTPEDNAVSSEKSAPLTKKSVASSDNSKESYTKSVSTYGNDLALGSSYDEPSPRRGKRHGGWSMKLYGENAMSQQSKGGGPKDIMMSAPVENPVFYNENVFANSAAGPFMLKGFGNMDYTEKVKHHLPISVGVQAGYALTDKLHLTTGLVYTYTTSDFTGTSGNTSVETTQKLHYLGVPLSLSYDVWGTHRLHTYVTVGGEGDVNIKNQTETDGVETSSKRDRMQWSANAAVGVQYDLVPQLGIYVEPGAKYYFDNGSQIENTFKDKKFNFNLQMGLRWNIK